MLRLSKLGDYGTVVMAHMARAPERTYSASELAAAVSLGRPTVTKLLKLLAHEKLVVSQRGAKGGYTLARTPAEISIAQIVDAVEGRIGVTECSVEAGLCAQEATCMSRGSWLRINRVIRDALSAVTLDAFAGRGAASDAGVPMRARAVPVEVLADETSRSATFREAAQCQLKP
ncbi:MAG TPA: SUF system Fe-S cluster assembly regulator [Rhodocyclaceae bacterium]|nr:SUF system Fe-S cluster assembly regulator [Rhodocyclaceae bacterium]